MEFKDYYATLGVPASASQDQIKRAYRKLARKYHPDVSQAPDALARFQAVAEAHEALIDVDRRAAYDAIAERHARGQPYEPPPGWDTGPVPSSRSGRGSPGDSHRQNGQGGPHPDDLHDFSEFFESLFGHQQAGDRQRPAGNSRARAGRDHHASVAIDLMDVFTGGERLLSLRLPALDAHGRSHPQTRQLAVQIPRGIRPGQQLRLAGQGAPGHGEAPAGDLYLQVQLLPHPLYRLDGADLYMDLPVSPWEAALGATVTTPTPDGPVALTIPPGASAGRQLRLKGRGLPGQPPGDLYAVLQLALPPAAAEADRQAWAALAAHFTGYDPRATQVA